LGTSACISTSSFVRGVSNSGGRRGPEERRVLALIELVETRVEHVAEQLVHDDLTVAADRILGTRRTQVADGHAGGRRSLSAITL
jgi:hypothetical protein